VHALNLARRLWRRGRNLLPVEGFHFDRPIVLLHSDDWGRVGLQDQQGLEELRSAGLQLGERPYDFYTLETADDVAALHDVLHQHRDSAGHPACIAMNFVVANLDFARMAGDGFRQIHLLPLAEGLPKGWNRPGLVDAYCRGIAEGWIRPGLHGMTHFCREAVERSIADEKETGSLLRKLWHAGTPYIHWRMPWIGYEYWDPEQTPDQRFLSGATQRHLIGQTVGAFAQLFSALPGFACAPGYRANDDTYKAWAQHGIRVAQNGPGSLTPPHIDHHGILQLYRNVEFEPALDPALSLETCIRQAEACFQRGIPAIVSMHSINFHSSVRDFRSRSLKLLNEFLSALEAKHPDLLYLHDEDLYEAINRGSYETTQKKVRVTVIKKKFRKSHAAPVQEN
jgi:hypothetical protein